MSFNGIRLYLNRLILLVLLIPALPLKTRGQNNLYYHYTIKDGLSGNLVYNVNQDKEGYIWIATDKGIAKFNGKTLKNFTLAEGLTSNDVFYVFIDARNRVWLSDYSPYLTYIYRDTIHKFKIYPDTSIFFKADIFYSGERTTILTKDYKLVAANDHSVQMINADSLMERLFPAKGFGKDSLYPYLFFYKNTVGAIRKDKIYVVDTSLGKCTLYLSGIDSFPGKTAGIGAAVWKHYIIGEVKKPDGVKYISFDFLTGKFKTLNPKKYFKDYSYMRFSSHNDLYFQISTNSGLLVLDSSFHVVDVYNRDNAMKDVNINSYFKDDWGNFWITTVDDGIYFVSSELSSFTQAPIKDILSKGNLSNIYYYDHHYFIFNEHEELFIVDQDFKTKYQYQLKLGKGFNFTSDQGRNFLLKDEDGYYIVSPRSFYHLDHNYHLTDLLAPDRLLEPRLEYFLRSIKDCILDTSDHSIIFSNFDCLYRCRYDGKLHVQELAHHRFTDIYKDSKGRYILSNDLGAFAIYGPDMKPLYRSNIRSRITGFFNDQYHNIIMSLDGWGVICFNPRLQKTTYIYSGNDVQKVNIDASALWISTHNFIKKYEYRDNRYISTNSFLNLKGLLYQDVYRVFSKQDTVYILCDKGILKCPRNHSSDKRPLFEQSLFISDINFGNTQKIVLSAEDSAVTHCYTKDNISFQLTCNSTSYFGNVQYYYYLEGNDNTWQRSLEENISYPALSPGTYTFHYAAAIISSDMITGEKVFTVIITPLWWQSWWFRSLILLIILGIIMLIIYKRIQTIRAEEKAVTERNKKMAELELSALQAQMNPHFTFNALSSIQSFIRTNATPLATELLQKFSLLIRLYLEFSRHKKISLKQEIRSLQLYTDIERLRFNDKFDVVIKTRSTLPPETVLIPPMMIQPLVENAINHGLYHKPGTGLLKILFWVRKNQIIVFIDDNGIGREKAKKLRSKLFPSRGNRIITDRIEVLKASGLAESSITIKDKYDENNIATGTRVILIMNLF